MKKDIKKPVDINKFLDEENLDDSADGEHVDQPQKNTENDIENMVEKLINKTTSFLRNAFKLYKVQSILITIGILIIFNNLFVGLIFIILGTVLLNQKEYKKNLTLWNKPVNTKNDEVYLKKINETYKIETDYGELFFSVLGFIFLIVIGFFIFQHFNPPKTEVSGEVKYDDCREKITLNTAEYLKQGGTFLCNDTKTQAGKSMGGTCIKTVTDSSGGCQTVYLYDKPAEETCGINRSLHTDDLCYCDYGYIEKGGSCISYTQDCQNTFGINSYGYSSNGTGGSTCYCSTGSSWNIDKTACIGQETLNQSCITAYGIGSYSTSLGVKNICDCSYGYNWNTQRTACVTTESINQICRSSFGPKSYYSGTVTDNKYNCQSY